MKYTLVLLTMLTLFTGCSKEPEPIEQESSYEFQVELTNLDDLAEKYVEFWSESFIQPSNGPYLLGSTTVSSQGIISLKLPYSGNLTDPGFFMRSGNHLDIPNVDPFLLVFPYIADFNGEIGTMNVRVFSPNQPDSVSLATATYILSTPTDGDLTLNEKSGIWFTDGSGNNTLQLPEIDLGKWRYNARLELGGKSLDFAEFSTDQDQFNCVFCSSAASGYNVPGMDFLQAHTSAGDFPLPVSDLSGGVLSIQICPTAFVENCFTLLKTEIPLNATANTAYQMDSQPNNFELLGTVTRKKL